jgi:hypothetical protein
MHAAKIILQVSLLVASGLADAHSTNALRARALAVRQPFVEYNPVMRPFAGKPAINVAIPAIDLGVYWALRKAHKPRAAKWFAYGESGENFFCAWHNARAHPSPPRH